MRDLLDRAYSPASLGEAIVCRLLNYGHIKEDHHVWEPHAGQGAFVKPLAERGLHVTASDISPLPIELGGFNRRMLSSPTVRMNILTPFQHDALLGWNESWGDRPDWVVGNTPFARHTGEWAACKPCETKAAYAGAGWSPKSCKKCDGTMKVPVMETIWHKHVEMARETARVGVAFLLRNSFIEPVEERRHLVDAIDEQWPVTPRPSFDGPSGPSEGTDTSGATVYIWFKDSRLRSQHPVSSLVWEKPSRRGSK